jgi:hypothetical protein
MKKFTVFTILFTVVVVVIAAETFVNKYLPSLSDGTAGTEATDEYPLPDELDLSAAIQSNVMGAADVGTEPVVAAPIETPAVTPEVSEDDFLPEQPLTPTFLETPDGIYSDIEDFSSTETATIPTNVYLTPDHVSKSGFVDASIESETFDGFLYKTVNIGDLYGVKSEKYAIKNTSTSFAKVYVVIPDDPKNIDEIYRVIKTRAADGLEIEVNETNDYGMASFFMNDARRPNVAFLTVKINSLVYGFSYPKQYHPQIKALVSNLMLGL